MVGMTYTHTNNTNMSFRVIENGVFTLPQIKCSERTYLIPELLAATGMRCAWCGVRGDLKKCQKCQLAYYCTTDCQKLHWKDSHKADCFVDNETYPVAKSVLTTLATSTDQYLLRALDQIGHTTQTWGRREVCLSCVSSSESLESLTKALMAYNTRQDVEESGKDEEKNGKDEEEKNERGEHITYLKICINDVLHVYHAYTVDTCTVVDVPQFCSVNGLAPREKSVTFDDKQFLATLNELNATVKGGYGTHTTRVDKMVFLACIRFALRMAMGAEMCSMDFAVLEWIHVHGDKTNCPLVRSALAVGCRLLQRRDHKKIDLTQGFDVKLSTILYAIGDGVLDANELLLMTYLYEMWL